MKTQDNHDNGAPGLQPGLQSIAESEAPSAELEAQGPDVAACVREARRRLEAQPQTDPVTGQVTPGNVQTMTVGNRSVQLQAALEPVRHAIYLATLTDLGYPPNGHERPPEALRMTARNLASLDVLVETFWTWIETRGVLTAKGKTRSAVTTFLSIIDRQTKLAAVIGLQRHAKDLGRLPLADYLEHERQQREQQQPTKE